MTKMPNCVIMLLLCPIILQSQIRLVTEIDGVSLENIKTQAALNNNKFYFQQIEYDNIYIAENDIILRKFTYGEILPNGPSSSGIKPYSNFLIANDTITIGEAKFGILQYDGTKWNHYNDENTNMTSTKIFGTGTNGKGEYIFLNRSGDNKIGFLSEGVAIVKEMNIIGEKKEYFYPHGPLGYYKENFYFYSGSKQLCKIIGDEIHVIEEKFSNSDKGYISLDIPFKNHNDKLWFATVDYTDQGKAVSRIVSYDGEDFEIHDFFFDQYTDTTFSLGVQEFEFDRNGKLWVLINHSKDVESSYVTLSRYNDNQELEYELNISDKFPETAGVRRILVDKAPEGTEDIYVIWQNGLLIINQNISSVEQVEAKPSMYFKELYPNPVRSTTTAEFYATHKAMETLRFSLSDYLGRAYEIEEPDVEYDRTTGKVCAKLNLSNIYPGYYYLLIQDNNYTIGEAVMVR